MTNAEKYKEVFGFYPSFTDCICGDDCEKCPIDKGDLDYLSCIDEFKVDWWNSEYKER